MRQRGRRAGAALTLVGTQVEVIERPQPPSELTRQEAGIWNAIVAAEPAEWFTVATRPLLAQYCRHVVQAQRLGELLADPAHTAFLEDYDKLLAMQRRESQTMAALARAMRLTQQSNETVRQRNMSTPLDRPWQE
jgi:hypothetical protein